MGFFSLYIIIMSDDDEDYFDPEIINFNEELDARAARAQEEHDPSEAFGLEMFGPTGRGSPDMDRQSPYQLSRNAAASLRSVGLDDERPNSLGYKIEGIATSTTKTRKSGSKSSRPQPNDEGKTTTRK
jgi:hypothetical protein